ncbi:6-phosphogluconolactonase [bacterium]|nr:6-phosphogluconolactonase [bacterium]MBU1989504.1 6-phosphogluconolactonase [bacterium]
MKNNYKLYAFEDTEHLVSSLCERIVSDLKRAIDARGGACLAVSGGSTPKKLFERLSLADLEWDKVTLTLVDERWVNSYDENSNERLVYEHLIKNKAKSAKFIPLKNIVSRAKEGTEITQNRLKNIQSLDVVVLGMGTDAHTASFFPSKYEIEELENALSTEDLCCATTATAEPTERITISRSFLLTASSLLLHIEGRVKKDVFDTACMSDDYLKMPIISMMQQEKPILEVYYA